MIICRIDRKFCAAMRSAISAKSRVESEAVRVCGAQTLFAFSFLLSKSVRVLNRADTERRSDILSS